MEITHSFHGEDLLISLKGELDESTAPYVRLSLDSSLEEAIQKNISKLILDFSGITFMDSTGIGVLIGRYKKCRKNNINILIKNSYGHVDKILQMTGIYEIMPKLC